MDPVVKLNVRRRVKDKNNSNKEDGSEDEEFDLQLAKLNNIESSELIATTNKDQANLPSLPEIAENNEHDLEQNANGSEVVQEKPKKGKGRPRKVPGALENSPKSPVNSSTQILRRSTRNK